MPFSSLSAAVSMSRSKLKMKFSKPYLNLDNVELGQAQKTIQKKMADLYESTPELEKSKSK